MAALVVLPMTSRLNQDQLEAIRDAFNPVKYVSHRQLASDDIDRFKNVVFVDHEHLSLAKQFPYNPKVRIFHLKNVNGTMELPGGQKRYFRTWMVDPHK